MSDGTMVMPFGKYKGNTLEEIPSSYLKWLSENAENDELSEAADTEYRFRSDYGTHFED